MSQTHGIDWTQRLPTEARPTMYVGYGGFGTIGAAVTAAPDGAVIYVAPGTYSETVTLPFGKALSLVGAGDFHQVVVQGATTTAKALVVNGFNCSVENIDFIGGATATAAALVVGDGFNAKGCRFEMANNVGIALHFKSGAYATYPTANGSASIARVENCEFCWAEVGVKFEYTDGLSCTQNLVKGCLFRNLSTACISEAGDAPVRNAMIQGNLFENGEDGTAPTTYITLSTTGDTGVIAGNWFATTVHAASKIALASGVLYVGNFAQAEGPATGGGTSGRPD